jgi:hypothetical protein
VFVGANFLLRSLSTYKACLRWPELMNLEEDDLTVATGGASQGLGAWQHWVTSDILEHLGELPDIVVHHVPVHAVVVGNLLWFPDSVRAFSALFSSPTNMAL